MSANTEVMIKPRIDLQAPAMYQVIYINDNKTTVEFVTSSLVDHFNYSELSADRITKAVHDEGSAVVAVLPFQIAEQKGVEVIIDARSQGYPFQVKVVRED